MDFFCRALIDWVFLQAYGWLSLTSLHSSTVRWATRAPLSGPPLLSRRSPAQSMVFHSFTCTKPARQCHSLLLCFRSWVALSGCWLVTSCLTLIILAFAHLYISLAHLYIPLAHLYIPLASTEAWQAQLLSHLRRAQSLGQVLLVCKHLDLSFLLCGRK